MPVDTGFSKGIEMVEDKDLGKVYVAPGFNFKGYNAMLVSDCSAIKEASMKGVDPEEMGIYLKNQLIKRLVGTGVFPKVTGDSSTLSPREGTQSRVLTLECNITELEPGSRALRYFVGFGAGATKVQVENEIRDYQTRQLYFKSADRRIAAIGGFGGDSKGFILSSLDQTAEAMGAFIKRISSGGKIEKDGSPATSHGGEIP